MPLRHARKRSSTADSTEIEPATQPGLQQARTASSRVERGRYLNLSRSRHNKVVSYPRVRTKNFGWSFHEVSGWVRTAKLGTGFRLLKPDAHFAFQKKSARLFPGQHRSSIKLAEGAIVKPLPTFCFVRSRPLWSGSCGRHLRVSHHFPRPAFLLARNR